MATIKAIVVVSVGSRSSGRPAAADVMWRRWAGGTGKSSSVGRLMAAQRADGGLTAGVLRDVHEAFCKIKAGEELLPELTARPH